MKLAIAVLLACAASPTFAGRRVGVAELEKTLVEAAGQADGQTARSLAGIELSERITDRALTRLLAHATGPRTKDVLQLLAQVSAFLDSPASERLAVDPPPPEEQATPAARP